MRRVLAAFALLGFLTLAGCGRWTQAQVMLGVPAKVEIDGVEYRTGFYDDTLWLQDRLPRSEEEFEVGGKVFRRMECGEFDCVWARIGPKTGGMLYCREDQWDEAQEYYADGENFDYYCIVGAKEAKKEEKQTFEVPEMDLEKFDALGKHGSTFDYDPFDLVHNKAAEYKEITIDTRKIDPRPYISFYKDSKDGIFTSYKAHYFFVMEGKLYQARYHNQSEEVVAAVEVPEETGEYFVELIEGLLEE